MTYKVFSGTLNPTQSINHGEIGRTISDLQTRDGQTDRQTDKKLNVFGRPGGG